MVGASQYCEIFKEAEQIGRLYILPGSHTRGDTFQIYVLPANELVIENGGINPPLNNDAVEVYGIVSGQPGWAEVYDWKHKGPWQAEFKKIYQKRRIEQGYELLRIETKRNIKELEESRRIQKLLDSY